MKKVLRLYILIPAVLLLFIGALFGGWYLFPKKPLDIVVLDKTVVFDSKEKTDSTAVYRKHMGLFWTLRNSKYVIPDNKKFYNYRTDYFGPQKEKDGTIADRSLSTLLRTPDLIYLADAYGTEELQKAQEGGLTLDEMAVVSDAYVHKATVVGEFNITPSKADDPVRAELQSLFGLKFSDWVGRYVKDMADLSDIPGWVLDLQERNFGRKWDYTGAGIVLASSKGELIVLEQGKDYTGNLSVSITGGYKKSFGGLKTNYYNWFEIVSSEYGTETVAEYSLPLTEEGKTKMSKTGVSGTFPAILLNKSGGAPVYYFAGDFNDYVASKRYGDFLFANYFYRIFSYDRAGDITNFYWNFYTPFMEKVLSEAKKASAGKLPMSEESGEAVTRLQDKKFEVKENGSWKSLVIKGFNINAAMPGSQPDEYTRDISVYRYFLDSVSEIGGNCVRVYDLMPPEFYRALYEYNLKNPKKPIFFFQSIVPPDSIASGENLSTAAVTEQKNKIRSVIDAVNGKGKVEAKGQRTGVTYLNNVSSYLLGYLAEFDTSSEAVKLLDGKNSGYRYNGSFVSGAANGSPATQLMALFCDEIFSYQNKTYGRLIPVGALGNQMLLPNEGFSKYNGGIVYDVSTLETADFVKNSLFLAYSLKPSDAIVKDNGAAYNAYKDDSGEFPYGGYLQAFQSLQNKYPVLVDRVSLSTNLNVFDTGTEGGLSEQEQGTGLVRSLNAIQKAGYLGGLVSDLSDSWSNCSEDFKPYTIPLKNNPLWHNTLDPTQNTGIIAVEPEPVTDIGMSLKDSERMSEVKLQTDEEYLYMTILLTAETNYETEKLIIGLDTYHRNYGEYFYEPSYFANSLSGMEYVIRFESKNEAALYVVPDYNRKNGKFLPKESYSGKYDLLTQLKYGTFELSNNCFYQTGNTMHIRIPWGLLNFTDPAGKIVISDGRTAAAIAADAYGLQTQNTAGIIFSLLIADRKTKDTLYIFPVNKQSNGYKSFSWNNWEKPTYQFRHKESFDILFRYFKSLK